LLLLLLLLLLLHGDIAISIKVSKFYSKRTGYSQPANSGGRGGGGEEEKEKEAGQVEEEN
jgi:hypothetical protein